MAVSVKDFLDAIRGRFNDEPNKVEVTGSNAADRIANVSVGVGATVTLFTKTEDASNEFSLALFLSPSKTDTRLLYDATHVLGDYDSDDRLFQNQEIQIINNPTNFEVVTDKTTAYGREYRIKLQNNRTSGTVTIRRAELRRYF